MIGGSGSSFRLGRSRACRLLSCSVSTRRLVSVQSCLSVYTLGDLAAWLLRRDPTGDRRPALDLHPNLRRRDMLELERLERRRYHILQEHTSLLGG